MQRVVWGEAFGRPGRDKFVPTSSITPGDHDAPGHDPYLAVDGDWIVSVVGGHTCGAGPGSGAGCEPGCGSEPVMKVAELEALGFVRRDVVLAIHKPVHRVFSWAAGGTTDYDPCPTCLGKAGVHECGCWGDEDITYVCAECDTTGRDSRRAPWPCRTAIAVGIDPNERTLP